MAISDEQPLATDIDKNQEVPPVNEWGEDASTLRVDDIKVVYHPGAGRQTKIYPFEDFSTERTESIPAAACTRAPWHPFDSREDFEFAELVHDARMSREVVERMLQLIGKVASGEARISFRSHSDVQRAWDEASLFYPTVCAH
jgi:hypothetical protein